VSEVAFETAADSQLLLRRPIVTTDLTGQNYLVILWHSVIRA